jgi:hypothetical protein
MHMSGSSAHVDVRDELTLVDQRSASQLGQVPKGEHALRGRPLGVAAQLKLLRKSQKNWLSVILEK